MKERERKKGQSSWCIARAPSLPQYMRVPFSTGAEVPSATDNPSSYRLFTSTFTCFFAVSCLVEKSGRNVHSAITEKTHHQYRDEGGGANFRCGTDTSLPTSSLTCSTIHPSIHQLFSIMAVVHHLKLMRVPRPSYTRQSYMSRSLKNGQKMKENVTESMDT
jgi:hypothetical protein